MYVSDNCMKVLNLKFFSIVLCHFEFSHIFHLYSVVLVCQCGPTLTLLHLETQKVKIQLDLKPFVTHSMNSIFANENRYSVQISSHQKFTSIP